MKDEFLRLIKHSITYGFFYSLMRAIGFILLPLYTRYLPPSRYGILELLTVTISVTMVIFQLGIHSAIVRFYVYFSDDEEKRRVVSTALFFMIFFISIVLLVLIPLSNRISILIGLGAGYKSFLTVALLITAFQTLYSIPLAIHRARGKPLTYSSILLSGAILRLILIVLFLVVLKLEIRGILLGTMYSAIFVFLLGSSSILKEINPKLFSLPILRRLLFFGIPLVPTSLAFQVLSISDRYFLQRMRTLDELGIYSVGYKIGLIMEFAVMAFQMAWGPLMFKAEKGEKASIFYSKVLTYFTMFFLTLAFIISVFADELVTILATPQYSQASTIIPLVALSYVFYGYYYVTAVGINLKNKTFYFPLAMFIAALTNIVLNFVLIPLLGMLGAAIATLISFIVLASLIATFSLRLYRVEYELNKLLLMFLGWGGLFIIHKVIPSLPGIGTIGIKLILTTALVLLYFHELDINERLALVSTLKGLPKLGRRGH